MLVIIASKHKDTEIQQIQFRYTVSSNTFCPTPLSRTYIFNDFSLYKSHQHTEFYLTLHVQVTESIWQNVHVSISALVRKGQRSITSSAISLRVTLTGLVSNLLFSLLVESWNTAFSKGDKNVNTIPCYFPLFNRGESGTGHKILQMVAFLSLSDHIFTAVHPVLIADECKPVQCELLPS